MEKEVFQEKFQDVKGIKKVYEIYPDFSFWCVFYHIVSMQLETVENKEEKRIEKNVILTLDNMDHSIQGKFIFYDVSLFYMAGLDTLSGFEIDKNEDGTFKHGNNFLVVDYANNALSFYCKAVEVLKVEKIG